MIGPAIIGCPPTPRTVEEEPGMQARTVLFGMVGCGLMGREFASAAARWAHLTELDVRHRLFTAALESPRRAATIPLEN
jgi:hypothetical protein